MKFVLDNRTDQSPVLPCRRRSARLSPSQSPATGVKPVPPYGMVKPRVLPLDDFSHVQMPVDVW